MTSIRRNSSSAEPARPAAGRGFTLLEALLALLIASAGFAAVLTALASAQKAQRAADDAQRALLLARTVLEEAFVGALPAENAVRDESGLTRWEGVRDGLQWSVVSRFSATRGMNLEGFAGAQEAVVGRPADAPALLPMERITARVGSVELTTVRW